MNEWQQYMTSERSEWVNESCIAGMSEHFWYVIVILNIFYNWQLIWELISYNTIPWYISQFSQIKHTGNAVLCVQTTTSVSWLLCQPWSKKMKSCRRVNSFHLHKKNCNSASPHLRESRWYLFGTVWNFNRASAFSTFSWSYRCYHLDGFLISWILFPLIEHSLWCAP